MSSHEEWRIAYARQALADLHARERLLEHPELPECQQLHFLQMACEKLCKAHLCGQGADALSLQSSHAYIRDQLPMIARQQFARTGRTGLGRRAWIIAAIRKLARQIELLAPAVDDGGRHPANCEYPWSGTDGSVRAPADHRFDLNLLYAPAGRHLLKVLLIAATELAQRKA